METKVFNAIVNLLNKLDEVTDASIGIFQMAMIHGMVYNGPTYEVESDALRALVGMDRPPKKEEWDAAAASAFDDVTPTEEEWLSLVVEDELEDFRELAEVDFARARFESLRGPIRELAALEKEVVDQFRPSKEWLERMFKIEDECGGHISVGGLAADLGMLPEDPEKGSTFLMMGSNGEPMGTMSNPSLDDLVYYMRSDASSVRLLSNREAKLADRCNTYDECPAEDPDVVECPMHPELGG